MEICLDKNELTLSNEEKKTLSNENFSPPDRIVYFGILINEQQGILLVLSGSGVMDEIQDVGSLSASWRVVGEWLLVLCVVVF